MSDYIERKAALAICEKEYQERLKMADWCGDTVAWNIAADVSALPAADVAPVVRCPQCIHHEDNGYHFCNKWEHFLPDDSEFFCAFGERKEDNT